MRPTARTSSAAWSFSPFKADTKHARLQPLPSAFGGERAATSVGTPAAPALAQIRSGGQLVWFRYRTDGTAPNTTIADGRRTRFTTAGQYYYGPARPAGRVRRRAPGRAPRALATDRLSNQAWQVTGGVGADRRDRDRPRRRAAQAVRPVKGAWGAFEIVARANALTIDDDTFPVFANLDKRRARRRPAASGLNWYLNRT